VDRLVAALSRRQERQPATPRSEPVPEPSARLAVARDAAFCFYYEENLEALRQAGFELVPFSPIHDRQLPERIDAIYLGGGYPESFAAELAANDQLLAQLRGRAESDLPIYGECGGMMYLARSLTGFDGVRHPMAGLLPIDVIMDRNFLAIGYARGTTLQDSPLGPAGTPVRGQEFHQSRITESDLEPDLFEVTDTSGVVRRAGYRVGSVAGSYLHLHFAQTAAVPEALRTAGSQSRSG
jgi:cobyrinic acid a,c-diamide synthase